MRWLGQKTRRSVMSTWATLLDTNFSGWASKTLEKHDIDLPYLKINSDRMEVKNYFAKAIEAADMVDLCRLDMLYVNEKYGL